MSDQHASESAGSPVVVNNNTMDAIVAVILFVIGVVVIFEARRLGAEWADDGPVLHRHHSLHLKYGDFLPVDGQQVT